MIFSLRASILILALVFSHSLWAQSTPDINDDGMVNQDDARVMYYAYTLRSILTEPGQTAIRATLLGGLSGSLADNDAGYQTLLRRAYSWQRLGLAAGGDLNNDGQIDEKDALIMYYTYVAPNLLGDGQTGGQPRLRSLLIGDLVNGTDADYRQLLRQANNLATQYAGVTVSFDAATYTATEGGTNATVIVRLSRALEQEAIIDITATPGGGATPPSGTSMRDYNGAPILLNFAIGDTSKTVTIRAEDDDDDDNGESVQLGFSNIFPTEIKIGRPATATVNLIDNDPIPVTVSFSAARYEATEGGTATVIVQLSQVPARQVVIPITATPQGGASAMDYSGIPASLTFTKDQTSRNFTVTAVNDNHDDDDESVLLGFGTLPTEVSAGSQSTATINLIDNDPIPITVSFGPGPYTATEGGASAIVAVRLSATPGREVVIPITATAQGTTSTTDYMVMPISLTFSSSQIDQSITVTAVDDNDEDDGESVQLGFGSLPTEVSAGSRATTTVSLVDNDPIPVTVSFGAAAYYAAEGGTAASVIVQLSAAPGREVVIPITATAQGTTSTNDYMVMPISLTFSISQTSLSVTVTAVDDGDGETGESVELGFGATLPAAVSAGSPSRTIVNLIDSGPIPVTVSFGAGTYSVTEGSAVTVTVALSQAPGRQVVVPVTVTPNGGATAPADYTGIPASLTFSASQASRSFTVTAGDDNDNDDNESLALGFGTPLPTGVTAGSQSTTRINLIDNDPTPVTVSFGAAIYTANELGTAASVTVQLNRQPQQPVTIPITYTPQGSTSTSDYSGPTMAIFSGNQTEISLMIMALDDIDDDNESVQLGFGTLPTQVTAGSPSTTIVNLIDND